MGFYNNTSGISPCGPNSNTTFPSNLTFLGNFLGMTKSVIALTLALSLITYYNELYKLENFEYDYTLHLLSEAPSAALQPLPNN